MGFPSLEDRKEFYLSFDAKRAFAWAKKISARPVFAINPGWYTKIATPQMRDLINRGYRMVYLRNVDSPRVLRRKLLKYLPEGVYYWRNIVSDPSLCHNCPLKFFRRENMCARCPNFLGQELMFDIDPEHLLGKKRSEVSPSDFYSVRDATVAAYDVLSERFTKLKVVYSGRGFHIHVWDDDAFLLGEKERVEVAEEIKKYGVDVPVAAGGVSLARLPYTLNGISGTVATPLKRKELGSFDPYHSSSSKSSS